MFVFYIIYTGVTYYTCVPLLLVFGDDVDDVVLLCCSNLE